jgi:hypothetical protein
MNTSANKNKKTKIKYLFLAGLKFLACAGIGIGASVGFWWAFTHDRTNVEAQKVWTEEAKEFDREVKFLQLHPEAEPARFSF